jgi:hypothetical protein
VSLAGSKRDADIVRTAEAILDVLRGEPAPQTERWIREQVEARPKTQAAALRMALRRDWIYRVGGGKRGDPYVYGLVSAGAETREPEYVPANMGVSPKNSPKTPPVLPPKAIFPPCREPGNQKVSCTSTEILSTGTDGKVVSLVPKSRVNGNGNGNGRHVNDSTFSTYSGSATSESVDEVDDSLFSNPDEDDA